MIYQSPMQPLKRMEKQLLVKKELLNPQKMNLRMRCWKTPVMTRRKWLQYTTAGKSLIKMLQLISACTIFIPSISRLDFVPKPSNISAVKSKIPESVLFIFSLLFKDSLCLYWVEICIYTVYAVVWHKYAISWRLCWTFKVRSSILNFGSMVLHCLIAFQYWH